MIDVPSTILMYWNATVHKAIAYIYNPEKTETTENPRHTKISILPLKLLILTKSFYNLDGVKEMLRKSGTDLKTLDVYKLRSDYARPERQKKELGKAYHSAENEVKQMNTELNKLKQYLGMKQDNETEKIIKKEQSR